MYTDISYKKKIVTLNPIYDGYEEDIDDLIFENEEYYGPSEK